jgi:hypothetical protein
MGCKEPYDVEMVFIKTTFWHTYKQQRHCKLACDPRDANIKQIRYIGQSNDYFAIVSCRLIDLRNRRGVVM